MKNRSFPIVDGLVGILIAAQEFMRERDVSSLFLGIIGLEMNKWHLEGLVIEY